MGAFLNFFDLEPLAPTLTEQQAEIYIADVEAQAAVEAPCITAYEFEHADAVKAILRQAVLRWHRSGEGALSSHQQAAGPFSETHSFDTRSSGEGRLYPSEIRRLKALCRATGTSPRRKAFTVKPR